MLEGNWATESQFARAVKNITRPYMLSLLGHAKTNLVSLNHWNFGVFCYTVGLSKQIPRDWFHMVEWFPLIVDQWDTRMFYSVWGKGKISLCINKF